MCVRSCIKVVIETLPLLCIPTQRFECAYLCILYIVVCKRIYIIYICECTHVYACHHKHFCFISATNVAYKLLCCVSCTATPTNCGEHKHTHTHIHTYPCIYTLSLLRFYIFLLCLLNFYVVCHIFYLKRAADVHTCSQAA